MRFAHKTVSSGWQHQAQVESLKLPFASLDSQNVVLAPSPGPCALEDDGFPFETLSDIAEAESWRKEINRPISHIHKWWAQRLGSVFRAMAITAFAPSGTNVCDLFYKTVRIPNAIIFDPFMGSGTTLVETVKLGARAIGRDINPVAHFLVKCALSIHDRKAILKTFHAIEREVADEIRSFYRATMLDGTSADVLYYFWVKIVDCPSCDTPVDLFATRIFARHAYPKKFPKAQAVCPYCGEINEIHVEERDARCSSCNRSFDPSYGPAKGRSAICPTCNHTFSIAKIIRATGKPPAHRMYAKLILLPNGRKAYRPAIDEDRALYAEAERALAKRKNAYPVVAIAPGYNTNQALGYNYRHWHEMFNARQLLCLSILADRIRTMPDLVLRELFTCLFSGALEFNNMFTSYKGEGTGAVRHMFAHHVLKPERVPLEANLWGTEKSSGSFSTLFKSRIRRALDYADNPFELRLDQTQGKKSTTKIYGLSEKIGALVAHDYASFASGRRVYLSCGDSGITDLPDISVDTVLTDPPFFDNVHYSQLADFFHVWQRHILGDNGYRIADSTRSDREVQNTKAESFTDRLAAVWRETHRVLKNGGLLAFTYHHSRPEGWRCMLQALMQAGFGISAAHPIKAEMSVAMPKLQAKEPIDLDIILVCRKRSQLKTQCWNGDLWETVAPLATMQADRMRAASRRKLSRNDVRLIVMAQLLRQLSRSPTLESALYQLDRANVDTEALIDQIHGGQNGQNRKSGKPEGSNAKVSNTSTIFKACVQAIQRGDLIEREGRSDKEFHFQNWFKKQLESVGLNFDSPGRNSYPDFRLVRFSEGFELKGLAYPGREADYDCNSQVPCGEHNGRQVYYVFGRYPANPDGNRYPVLDFVLCHGSLLNADNTYFHKNKSFRGFGSYGDILVRDRKMYVAPTPFALADGTAHRRTLILPDNHVVDDDLIEVGTIRRREIDQVVVAYSFDLRTNKISITKAANPNAGREHVFKAYRVLGDPSDAVTLRPRNQILAGLGPAEAAVEADED